MLCCDSAGEVAGNVITGIGSFYNGIDVGGRTTLNGHLLLAEDNADMRDYLVSLLSNAGYRVDLKGQAFLSYIGTKSN